MFFLPLIIGGILLFLMQCLFGKANPTTPIPQPQTRIVPRANISTNDVLVPGVSRNVLENVDKYMAQLGKLRAYHTITNEFLFVKQTRLARNSVSVICECMDNSAARKSLAVHGKLLASERPGGSTKVYRAVSKEGESFFKYIFFGTVNADRSIRYCLLATETTATFNISSFVISHAETLISDLISGGWVPKLWQTVRKNAQLGQLQANSALAHQFTDEWTDFELAAYLIERQLLKLGTDNQLYVSWDALKPDTEFDIEKEDEDAPEMEKVHEEVESEEDEMEAEAAAVMEEAHWPQTEAIDRRVAQRLSAPRSPRQRGQIIPQ